jgi:hypothetical protein
MKKDIVAAACCFALLTPQAKATDIPLPVPRPVVTVEKPAKYTSCQVRLTAMKVVFKPLPPVSDPKGCSIVDPVEISALPDGSALTPPAQLSCETAIAIAVFMRDVAQQKAISILGSTIKTFRQDSAYVCRARNGTTKLSEHAYGRAIDLGAFIIASGDTISVKAADKADVKHDLFLSAVRTAACGPFTTVLGPGSDADHALHFHFDLAPRKGRPFCQ